MWPWKISVEGGSIIMMSVLALRLRRVMAYNLVSTEMWNSRQVDHPALGLVYWQAIEKGLGNAMASNTFISPENEQFIQQELESGVYQTRGELLDQAVGLLKRRRDLQREIQAGIDSGPAVPAGEVFVRLEQKARQLATRDSP